MTAVTAPLGGTSRTIRPFGAFVAIFLMGLTPFLSFARFHDYPVDRPEILISLVIIAAASAVVALVLAIAPAILQAAILAIALILFIDLQFGFTAMSRELVAVTHMPVAITKPLAMAIMTGAFGSALVAIWLLRANVVTVLATIFVVMASSTFIFGHGAVGLGDARSPTTGNGDVAAGPPPLVHIILDEHIGVEGIPSDIGDGAELRLHLRDLYEARGFSVFGRAYSMYFDTENALPNLLNFTAHDTDRSLLDGITATRRMTRNAYFDLLAERGYRLRVYQSDFMDFCSGNDAMIESCHTYRSTSPAAFRDLDVPVTGKLRLLWSMYLERASTYVALRRGYRGLVHSRAQAFGIALPAWNWERSRVGPLPTVPVIDALAADLGQAAAGSAFFVHLLSPHYPYVFDRACQVNPRVDQWIYATDESLAGPRLNSDAGWRLRYELYIDQTFCLHEQLAPVFDALANNAALKDAVVVIQGDHGSRINVHDPITGNVDRLTRDDFIDGFSTFFVGRSERLVPGYHEQLVPVQDLLARIWDHTPPSVAEPTVFLTDRVTGPLHPVPAAEALGAMRD